MTKLNWQDLVTAKQQECAQRIPSEWKLSAEQLALVQTPRLIEADVPRRSGLLSEFELDVTENYSANQLLTKLASGQVSSIDVTTAFCKRAALAQQLVCAALSLNDTYTDLFRPRVLRRHSFLKPWSAPNTWILT
jgi:amidase